MFLLLAAVLDSKSQPASKRNLVQAKPVGWSMTFLSMQLIKCPGKLLVTAFSKSFYSNQFGEVCLKALSRFI
jgi:hypothetical protein